MYHYPLVLSLLSFCPFRLLLMAVNRLLTYARGTLLFPARPCSPNPSGVFAEAAFPLASGRRGREGSGSGSGSGPRGTLAAHARSHPPPPSPPPGPGFIRPGPGRAAYSAASSPRRRRGGGGTAAFRRAWALPPWSPARAVRRLGLHRS